MSKFGKRSDAKAQASIAAAGWEVSHGGARTCDGRYVATKTIIEEDHSVTRLFESTYTLEGLAKQVTRREREEGRS